MLAIDGTRTTSSSTLIGEFSMVLSFISKVLPIVNLKKTNGMVINLNNIMADLSTV